LIGDFIQRIVEKIRSKPLDEYSKEKEEDVDEREHG
jgi:hypothetical protein